MTTDKEYQALIDALSSECERLHKALNDIRDEIEESITDYILGEEDTNTAVRMGDVMSKVFEIIDKYKAESEE